MRGMFSGVMMHAIGPAEDTRARGPVWETCVATDLSDVDRLAARLREMQAGFNDETPEERARAVDLLIREAIEKIVPSQRGMFLAELQRRFPTWDGAHRLAREAPVATQDQQEDRDWTWHLDRLIQLAETLDPHERRALQDRLVRAELAPPGGEVAWPDQSLAHVCDALYAGERVSIDAERALDLVAQLSDMAMRLDKVIRAVWVNLLPEDRVRQPAPIQRVLAKYLAGEIEPEQGEQQIKELRQRAQLMIGLLADAGRIAFGRVEFLMPEQIERSAPKGGLMSSREAQCWQTYKKRAGFLEREIFQQEIRRDLGEELRKVMGAGGSGTAR